MWGMYFFIFASCEPLSTIRLHVTYFSLWKRETVEKKSVAGLKWIQWLGVWERSTAFTLGQKSSSTSIRHRFQFCDKCKQVQVDLGRIKKIELFEKNKLLFTNLFLKISRIIVIDLHLFCSVNRSHNRIHVHQVWRAIFYWYWWPVLEFEFRIGAISVNSWFWINLC